MNNEERITLEQTGEGMEGKAGADATDKKTVLEWYEEYHRGIAPYDEVEQRMTCREAMVLMKEAGQHLPECRFDGSDGDPHIYAMRVAVDVAIEALRKQVPQKPKGTGGALHCPECGWEVYDTEWDDRCMPYCEVCGQAIAGHEEFMTKWRHRHRGSRT